MQIHSPFNILAHKVTAVRLCGVQASRLLNGIQFMTEVKISIVMPCFNSENLISDSIDSIICQDHANYELIIVDGGSTDNTLNILRQYGDKITILISEPDRGVPDALNKGFNACTGEVLCWLNSDDVYVSRRVFSLVAEKFMLGDTDFAYGHSVILDYHGSITKTQFSWLGDCSMHRRGMNIFTGSLFFSKQAWTSFRKFDLQYSVAFEYELLDFLYEHFHPKLIDSFLAGFRIYPGTISNSMSKEMIHQKSLLRKEKNDFTLMDKISHRAKRLYQLSISHVLLRVIRNRVCDIHRGKTWRDLLSGGET